MKKPLSEDPPPTPAESTELPDQPGDVTPVEEHGPTRQVRNRALWLSWVGIAIAGLSAVGTVLALVVSYGARTESQQLLLDKKLDDAWDALGGDKNISNIDDFARADVELARRLVRDAKTIREDSPRVRLVAAAMHMASSNLEKAEEELRQGIRTSPADYDLRHNLATVLTGQQRWSEAATEYEAAMALAPQSASPHLGLGYLQRAQGNHEGAITHYLEAVRLDPEDHVVRKELGLTLIKIQRTEEAVVALRKAVELSPRFAELRYHLGSGYLIMGEHNSAAAQFEEAIRLAPEKYPDAYVSLGLIRGLQNDVDQAEEMLVEALRLNPNNVEANNNLGALYIGQNKLDEAIRLLELAVSIEPSAARYFNLGNAYRDSGDEERAMASYRSAVRADPNYYDTRVSLGRLYAELGRNEEAAEQFEEAIRIDPDNPAGHSDLGVVFSVSNRTEEAIKKFEHALRLDPDSAETHLNLGVASETIGNSAMAERALRTALRISPELTKARKSLGRLLAGIGNFHAAATEFREGIRLHPDDAELHNHLGVVLVEVGRTEEAIEEFRTATTLDPDLAVARRNLAEAVRKFDGPEGVE